MTATTLTAGNLSGKLPASRQVATAATGESAAVRGTLIGVAALFLALFVFFPLAIVFFQAVVEGVAHPSGF